MSSTQPNKADILVLVGTKAQFIKTAPILRELSQRGLPYRLIYTGQHSETFDALEAAFGTRPADDLLVPGTEADSTGGLLGWALRFWLAALKRIWRGEWSGARWGAVHGDTLSTLFTAIALRIAGIPVAHIEAGLRSPQLLSPFPEEIIRRLVSRIAQLHLAPDETAANNLSGIRGQVVNTQGNTLRDALLLALRRLAPESGEGGHGGYAIASLHRSENLSSRARFDLLMNAILLAAEKLPVKFVLHPVTRRKLQKTGWRQKLEAHPHITLLERTDYIGFVELMLGARFLMTDGGSNQEEAAMMGLPTLLMRTATERPDGLDAGTAVLSELKQSRIAEFLTQYHTQTWVLRSVEQRSPSAVVVDALGSKG